MLKATLAGPCELESSGTVEFFACIVMIGACVGVGREMVRTAWVTAISPGTNGKPRVTGHSPVSEGELLIARS